MASTVVRRDRLRRWALVAAVAAVLVSIPAVVAAIPVSVPPVEAGTLRELILRSANQPYQGYAESTGGLDVPDLPNLSQVSSLLNGTTRIRSWYDSPDRWRFDVLTLSSERDTYHNSDGEFVWDYGTNLVTQQGGQILYRVSGSSDGVFELANEPPVRLPRAGDLLPPDLARRVLSSAPGDRVESLPGRRIAGIGAAGLRVRPADPDTSIGYVDIWADPGTGLPLQVEVTARGADHPVLVTRFLELSLDRPPAGTLTPNQPKDAGFTLTTAPDIEQAMGQLGPVQLPETLAGRAQQAGTLAGLSNVGLYGTGLSAFVVLPIPRNLAGSATDAARKGGATDITLPGGTGVQLTIAPLTVIVLRSNVARRSYLLAGLVNPALLQRAAGDLSTVPRSGR
jgi:hypothetical protein